MSGSSLKLDLLDVAIAEGDRLAVKTRLAEMGIRPAILMRALDSSIKWQCAKGGRGVGCQHEFTATPLEALRDGCPHCQLLTHILEDPPQPVPEEVLLEAVKKQHKAIKKSDDLAKKRSRRRSGLVGKYSV